MSSLMSEGQSEKWCLNFSVHSAVTVCWYLFILQILNIKQVTGNIARPSPTTAASLPLHLRVAYVCESTATLELIVRGKSDDSKSQRCDLTYYEPEKTAAQIIDIYLDSHSHDINLYNLSLEAKYKAFLVCDASKTNEVSFFTDSRCENRSSYYNHTYVTSYDRPGMVSSYSKSASFDSVEWPLGIVFALVGVSIFGVVAFSTWKKYQRRQRILRIFRQGQNDPFQALYSPTQDSYSF